MSYLEINFTSFLQVDLGVIHYVCAVATQGDPDIHGSLQYVVRYSLQLSVNADDFDWTEYEQVEKLYILYDDYFVRV